MLLLRQYTPDVLGGIGLSLTVLTLFIGPPTEGGNLAPTIAWAVVLTVIFVLAARWARQPREYRLKKGSAKFNEFYSKWYRGSGDIYVFCDGLEWMAAPDQVAIVQSLEEKGHRGHIFVRQMDHPLVEKFKGAGLSVDEVPPSIQIRAHFSLRLDNGHRVAIVRKDVRSDRKNDEVNIFIESNDRHLVLICEDFFRSINPDAVR